MSELHRAALLFGAAAALMAATSAFAIDTGAPVTPDASVSADTQQAVALVSGGVAAKASGDPSCPSVSLAPDGDTRRADGAKATVEGLARDCANLGAETILKIALVGEGERKRAKASAAFDAPVTIQVRDAEGRDVETRRINLKVEMPEGVQKVSFRHVEENVSLPPPSADGYGKWTIIVGFDPTTEDVGDVAEAAVEEAEAVEAKPVEKPRVRAFRSARSKGSRSVRAYAVRSAGNSGRRRIVLKPAPAPAAPPAARVTMTVRPPAAPTAGALATRAPAPVTTTGSTSGSSMARAAAAFTERRDKALQDQQRAQQQTPARQQRPPQAAQRARPVQPQAATGSQPPFRTAGR